MHYGEQIEIDVRTESVSRTSIALRFEVLRDDQPIITGQTVYVIVDGRSFEKRPLPSALLTGLTGTVLTR